MLFTRLTKISPFFFFGKNTEHRWWAPRSIYVHKQSFSFVLDIYFRSFLLCTSAGPLYCYTVCICSCTVLTISRECSYVVNNMTRIELNYYGWDTCYIENEEKSSKSLIKYCTFVAFLGSLWKTHERERERNIFFKYEPKKKLIKLLIYAENNHKLFYMTAHMNHWRHIIKIKLKTQIITMQYLLYYKELFQLTKIIKSSLFWLYMSLIDWNF